MKVLMVVTDCEVGGITTSSYHLCNELCRRGHDVTFLDMSGSRKAEAFLQEKIEKRYLGGLSRYWQMTAKSIKREKGAKKVLLLGLAVVKKLTNRHGLWNKLIFSRDKHARYDLAIAFRQCAPCYSYVLNKVKANKKIAFVHGDVQFMGGNEVSFLPYMPKFDKIAYVSVAAKDNFVRKYPSLEKNAHVIYNTFDAEDIVARSRQEDAVNVEDGKKVIVTVARIDNEIKRIHWIPQICRQLKERGETAFRWYVIGDGPDLASNVELAHSLGVEDVLQFVGGRENPFALEKHADFTVLVSKTEAYPMTVIESFILKKPVITTEFCAAKEMVIPAENGLIVKSTIDDVVDGVWAFLNDRDGVYTKCRAVLESYDHTNDKPYQQLLAAVEA